MVKKFYVTTAIDYVNAKPHIGHAFEKVVADTLARWKRMMGFDVFFLTGVDENAQKNVQAAEKAGVPVKEFIDKNAASFIELCKKLDISYDDFIRTTAREHSIVVQKILQKMIKNGDAYKSTYEGLYCIGCETYYTEKDLINGKCPEHNKEPELRKEEAYFFRLGKYKKQLLKLIPKYVMPESRRNEALARVREELNDICISRKDAKWGIDFPDDKNFKVWVWIDALINYVSGLKNKEKKYWPADVHIIGKGINWFHSIIWPAVLMSSKYKLPKTLLVHGYINVSGSKMSKSIGNVIDPVELVDKYGSDSVRYSLLKNLIFEDSDYSEDIIISRNNNELADKLGNLVLRVSTLAERYGIQKTENKLLKKLNLKKIEKLFDSYEFDKVLNEIFAFIDDCNEYVQKKKLWETKDKKALYELVDSIKAIAILLHPFIPETAGKIAKQLNFKIEYKNINKPLIVKKIKKSPILFEKIEVKKSEEKQGQLKKEKIEGITKMSEINFSEWEKLDLRVAEIISVDDIEYADKLYKLKLNVGKLGERVVCAGLKKYYDKKSLKGKKVILFTNLQSRTMKGIESCGMLLAAVSEDESKVVLISPEKDIENGSRVR